MASCHRRTRPLSPRSCIRARTFRSLVKGEQNVSLRARSCRAVRGVLSRAWRMSRSRGVTRVRVLAMPRGGVYAPALCLPLVMPPEKKSFIKVDELLPRVSLEQAVQYYGG